MANTALATIKPKEFGDYLERQRANLERISGKNVDVERLVTTVLLCFSRNPALMNCTTQSVFRAVLQATEMGLIPGSGNGDAYLVPFGKECTLIPGYRGYVRLALDGEKILDVQPRAVFKGDVFEYAFGLHPRLDHTPSGNTNPDDLTHSYVVVRMANGLDRFDVMTRSEIDKIRSMSAGKNGDLWTKHYVAAAKKCPIRRDAKFWPQTRALNKALALDNALDLGDAGLMEFELPEAQPEAIQEAVKQERIESARTGMKKAPNGTPVQEEPVASDAFSRTPEEEAAFVAANQRAEQEALGV